MGRTRSLVAETTNAAAMLSRNAIASPSRSAPIVAAMSQTLPLKNTNVVSRTTGSARTAKAPIVATCETVMRTAQPTTDPTPLAVRSNTSAVKMTAPGRWDGSVSTTITMPTMLTATVAAIARLRPSDIRDTSQPIPTIRTGASATIVRTTQSRGVGFSPMLTSSPLVIRNKGKVQQ